MLGATEVEREIRRCAKYYEGKEKRSERRYTQRETERKHHQVIGKKKK